MGKLTIVRYLGSMAAVTALAGSLIVVSVTPVAATESLSSPTNVRVVATEFDNLTIAWNRATDDDSVGFDRFYRVIVDGVWRTGSYEDSATVRQLEPGRTYTVQVQQTDTFTNEMSEPVTISATTLADTSPPTTPENLRVTSEGLTWDASDDNRGVLAYHILVDGEYLFSTRITRITFTELKDMFLVTPGQVLTVSVKAMDATRLLSGNSNTVTTVVP